MMNAKWFESVVDALGWCLVHFMWQAVVIAAVLCFALSVTRRFAPQIRYAIAAFAMFAMLAWAATTFASEYRTASAQVAAETIQIASTVPTLAGSKTAPAVGSTASEVPAASEPVPNALGKATVAEAQDSNWPTYLVGLWAVGVAFFSLRLLRSWCSVKNLKRTATEPIDGQLKQCFSELCLRMRLSRPVRLLISESARVPMVIGWIKPVVLVPAAVLAGLSSAQLESVLAHELTHIRRHDYLVNLLQLVVETLFFFHPAIWWVGAQLRKEREHCCDDVAAKISGDIISYATALTALEGMRIGAAPALAVAANDGSLLARVRRLVGQDEPPRSAWPALALVPVALAVTLWTSASVPLAGAADEEKGATEKAAKIQTANRAGLWELAGGVRLEVDRNLIHASDIATSAILHWPADDDGSKPRRHRSNVASDAFAAREPWSLAWDTDEQVLWIAKGKLGGKPQIGKMLPTLHQLKRVDFSDSKAIKSATANGSGPPDFAPAEILKALRSSFDIPPPAEGKLWSDRTDTAELRVARVTVQVIDGDSEKPIPSAVLDFNVGKKVHSVTADQKGEISLPTEVINNGMLRVNTHGYLPGEAGSNLFGAIKSPHVMKAYRGEGIDGKVLSPDGSPVAGAWVSVRARIDNIDTMKKLGLSAVPNSWDHGQYSNWGTVAKTDQDGNYHFTKPIDDDLSWSDITCKAEGFAKLHLRDGIRVVDPDWKFAVRPNDLILTKGIKVRLRVVNSEGVAMPDMSASTIGEEGRHVSTGFGFSDAEGKFPERLMMPGSYQISAPKMVDSHGNQTGPQMQRTFQPSELPLPFVAHSFVVEEDRESQEVTVRALPQQLVRFNWEDRRKGGSLRPYIAIEHGDMRWQTNLELCDLGAGKIQMCAQIPADMIKGFLRIGKHNGVYHFQPAGGGVASNGVTAVAIRDDHQPLGTIIAEDPATLLLKIKHGGKPWGIKRDEIEVTAKGRFGERKLRGRSSTNGETWVIKNLYPGETIDFRIADSRFKQESGSEKELKPGEKRVREIVLGGH